MSTSLNRNAVTKTILVWSRYVLLIFGLSALGYYAWVIAERHAYQDWAYRQMRTEKTEKMEQRKAPLTVAQSNGHGELQRSADHPKNLQVLLPFAQIEIPRLGVSAMVAEGDTPRVLRVAVGHVPDTALPGENGNIALAGHRDTFFRGLGRLKPGDLIKLTTLRGQYQYAVRFTEIVAPSETSVLNPVAGQTLTLVTCYPFHFVGAAPRRFIVRARRVGWPGNIPNGNTPSLGSIKPVTVASRRAQKLSNMSTELTDDSRLQANDTRGKS